MIREAEDKDLLVEFELKALPDEYREYYKIKRNNLFSSIQNLPEHWTFFCKIDQIWHREVTDLEVGMSPETALPMTLYINAHSKIRISMELAFSACMQESRSVLRDAVESVAHAHHMLRDVAHLKAWLGKYDQNGEAVFKKAFVEDKKKNLFKGVPELHEKFCQLSETGSHPTPLSLSGKVTFRETESSRGMAVTYTGVTDPRLFAMELFSRLLTCYVMECTFFDDYNARLKLDPKLMSMRQEFEQFKERLRQHLIKKYEVKPPPKNPTRGKP